MTATATAKVQAAPKPARIRPLVEEDRIATEGVKNMPPAWITLPTVVKDEEDKVILDAKGEPMLHLDNFYRSPGEYLIGSMPTIQPYQIVYVTDDATSVFSIGLVLMIRAGGSFADVVELLRKPLSPAVSAAIEDGWSYAHKGPALGWCVLKDGIVRMSNIATEHIARRRLVEQSDNWRHLGTTSINPKTAEYRDGGQG